jgi:transcriptional regulator of acetoin/glycerol metabolism
VRELRNVIEYAAVIGEGPVFAPTDLPPELLDPAFSSEEALPRATEPVATTEAARILRALERSAGSRERAAKVLGISRVTLWRRMRDLGLSQHGSA